MKKHICILCIHAILFFVVSNAYAAGSELDSLHQLLDQVEQAWQQHDIEALTNCYSDRDFLLIVDTPKGAMVLNRAQAIKSISGFWVQVKSHQFVSRDIRLDGNTAWMHLKIADRMENRSYPISECIACAVKIDGKWKMCFGMPAFFELSDPVKPYSSARIIQPDEPHPIKDIITTIWLRKVKDFPKGFDRSKASLNNVSIIESQNVAIASANYTCRKNENEQITLTTQLFVFARVNDNWTLVADIPFKYEIASTMTNQTILTSSQLEERKQQWKGQFCGIGVQLEENSKGLLIKSIIPNSPASSSGLAANEIITEINGKSTVNLPLKDAVELIKGPEGSAVNIEVLNSSGKPRKLAIVRNVVRVSGVTSDVLEDNVGLITISSFNNETVFDVKNTLDRFAGQNIRGIVLDLRENQGGMVTAIQRVAELFVPEGSRLWMIKFNSRKPKWVISSSSYAYKFKLAVLISEKTMGGELLASALKNIPGIVILGRKSSGAARIRGVEKQSGNQATIVDRGIYLAGPDLPITGLGVKPDISFKTQMTAQQEINQAVKELRIAIQK